MRVSWIIFTALCTVVLLLSLCAGTVYFASGSGPGVAEPVPPRREIPVEDVPALRSPDLEDFESEGEFLAWLEHPEHVFEANLMQLRIRLFPETNAFPGMQTADVNCLDDMIVQATVRMDVSVPLWNVQIVNRPQSHIAREKARGREALEFCRRAVLSASGLLVVAPRYADSDRLVHCWLELIDEAGDRVDLGELLVKNGFAAREVLDWGRRVPR